MVEKYARVVQGLSHHSQTMPIDTPSPPVFASEHFRGTSSHLKLLVRISFAWLWPSCLTWAFSHATWARTANTWHAYCISPGPKPRAGIANRSQHSSSEPSQGLSILLHLALPSATTSRSGLAGQISLSGWHCMDRPASPAGRRKEKDACIPPGFSKARNGEGTRKRKMHLFLGGDGFVLRMEREALHTDLQS